MFTKIWASSLRKYDSMYYDMQNHGINANVSRVQRNHFHLEFILFSLVVSLTGCGPVHKNDIVGKYVAIHSYGIEQLQLAADGSYFQTFTPKDKSLKPVSASGKWSFNGEHLELFDSLLVDDFYGDLSTGYSRKKSGVNLLRVSSSLGKTVIHVGANTDVVFTKQ